MPRSLAGAAISFGLVTIPVKLYSATRSLMPAFHLIHQECGSRIREQLYCPKDERVVSRDELVRGCEIAKDRYVTFTPEELDALEVAGSRTIDIEQFVPLRTVDPVYFEGTPTWGRTAGGDKAYRLLAEVMRDREEVALGTHVMRGKENLVAVRAYRGASSSTRSTSRTRCVDSEPSIQGKGAVRQGERNLALRLVETLKQRGLRSSAFQDRYRARVEKAGTREGARQGHSRRAVRRPTRDGRGFDGRPPEESGTPGHDGNRSKAGHARGRHGAPEGELATGGPDRGPPRSGRRQRLAQIVVAGPGMP